MRLADAWALLPELAVQARDATREERCLQTLACLAGGFTSELALAPPAALLLEVGGSLRLFGGVDALLARVAAACAAQGYTFCMALAPTPRAALLLSACGEGVALPAPPGVRVAETGAARRTAGGTAQGAPAGSDAPGVASGFASGVASDAAAAVAPRCCDLAALPGMLAPLPIAVLELPESAGRRLAGFGVRCIGDLLRLPRAGLGRRFGAAFVQALAQALGELPDPRPRFVFPESFAEGLELPSAVEDAGRLVFAAERLVMQLCGWLTARSAGVRNGLLQLEHASAPASGVTLAFATVTRDPRRIGRILRERLDVLARSGLAAPVTALSLRADAPEALPGCASSLFGEAAAGEGVPQLIERLQARLGASAVHGLAIVADHRPENAVRPVAPGAAANAPSAAARPCWLLPQPQPLAEAAGRPQRNGALTLLAGPERIESGWWDEGEAGAVGDLRRDYFVALSPQREWLWIFRTRAGWFLHGIYG